MIIGLSPVDGVTDAAFREIVDTCSKPNLLYTEFIPTEGLLKGKNHFFAGIQKHSTITPTVIQFFGSSPEQFYLAYIVAAFLGYQGVDVNMGCPDASVVRKGGGAALILQPRVAQQIIRSLKKAREDLHDMQRHILSKLTLPQPLSEHLHRYGVAELTLPWISVKTRTGYDAPVTQEWITTLAKEHPDYICVHGRTLKQRYTGQADWSQITVANTVCKEQNVRCLGNGDIHSYEEAIEKCKVYQLDGVLVGRAAFGNPWFFSEQKAPNIQDRFRVILRHCRLFLRYRPDLDLKPMRKHLAWYCKSLPHAAPLKQNLMTICTIEDVKKHLLHYLSEVLPTALSDSEREIYD